MAEAIVGSLPGLANLLLLLSWRQRPRRGWRIVVGWLFACGTFAAFVAAALLLVPDQRDLPPFLLWWASFLLAGIGVFGWRYTQPGVRPTSWAHPFAFLIVVPLFTVVATWSLVEVWGECGDRIAGTGGIGYTEQCDAASVKRAHLVGVLNLLPFAWVVVAGWTRWAALAAGSLGAIRFLLPQLLLPSSGTVEVSMGVSLVQNAEVQLLGALLWVLTLLLMAVLALVGASRART